MFNIRNLGSSLLSAAKLDRLLQALKSLNIDEAKGIITAYDERFLFIPVGLIHSIEDRLTESFGPVTATSFQYEIGKQGGAQYMSIAKKSGFDIKRAGGLDQIADRLGTLSGWGKVSIVDFDLSKKIARIRWTNGVSVRNTKGKTPVCHFGRGILTGAMEQTFGRKLESLEMSCQGKGDKYCEAVIGEPAEITRLAESSERGRVTSV
jgi:predicted hydrocarbon binding protein